MFAALQSSFQQLKNLLANTPATLVLTSLLLVSPLKAEPIALTSFDTKLTYQDAAKFSSLQWQNQMTSPIQVKLSPIKNFSGIPLDSKHDNADYYEHGNMPRNLDVLFSELVVASHFFNPSQMPTDIQMEITIDQYKHPFKYAPDKHWYKTLQDQVDRWAVTKKNSQVSLTLKLTSNSHLFKPWLRRVETSLSHCDLNANTHRFIATNHSDESLRAYTNSTMGQAFVAAGNYLILQAMEHLNQSKRRAQILGHFQNELLLSSETDQFIVGQYYDLVYNNPFANKYQQPAGKVQVVKSMGNQAIAYPVDLRFDHIKVGDWIEVSQPRPMLMPNSNFSPRNQCANVSTAAVASALLD